MFQNRTSTPIENGKTLSVSVTSIISSIIDSYSYSGSEGEWSCEPINWSAESP